MLYIGIDDAGRGPVIGPMILAGVLADEDQVAQLKKLGVKDSKMLTPKQREFLASRIKKIVADAKIVQVSAAEIDEMLGSGTNLNKVEAQKMAEVINGLNKGAKEIEVIIDCPSVNIESWKNYLAQYINAPEKIKLRCEHKADVNHAIVSAASILAKVTRDAEVEKIRKKYDVECGSGYPADPVCVAFLRTPKARELARLGFIRTSWQTWKDIVGKKGQKGLGEF